MTSVRVLLESALVGACPLGTLWQPPSAILPESIRRGGGRAFAVTAEAFGWFCVLLALVVPTAASSQGAGLASYGLIGLNRPAGREALGVVPTCTAGAFEICSDSFGCLV